MKRPRGPSFRTFSLLLTVATASCIGEGPTLPDGAPAPGPSAATSSQVGELVSGRVIVGLLPGASIFAATTSPGMIAERAIGENVWIVRVPEGTEEAWAEALRRNPNVRFAEPDYLRTFGTLMCALCALSGGNYMGYRWDLQNDGVIVNSAGTVLANTGLAGADLNWTPAFQQLGANFPGSVVVAILDSGIRLDHEDLVGRVIGGYNFRNNSSNYADDFGHGTHVAGIVAARAGNGKGAAGTAWGPNVRFLIVKVCGPSAAGYACSDSAIFQGINWAIAQGADVINISLGGSSASNVVRTALQTALAQNVLPVCAAGNNSQAVVSYPAAFPECVAVSATNWSDNLASYSNWGSPVDLSAPGGDSESPSGYSYILSSYYESATSYAFMAGTSMAAPQVTGLAALLYSQGMTRASDVLNLMKSSADDLGPFGYDTRFGYGRINVGRAIQVLTGGSPPTPNQPPVTDFAFSCVGLSCTFTDTSTDTDGQVTAWSWTFGDGASSTQRNPSHTYAAGQSYTVSLTATDEDGASGQRSRTVTVSLPATGPTAGFTFSCTFLVCTFTDASVPGSSAIGSRSWNFGDGGAGSGTSVQHTFWTAGTFQVTLTVTDANNLSDPETKLVTVQAAPPPPTGPTAGYTYGCSYLVCTFSDVSVAGSTAIATRSWSFGDGTPAVSGSSVQHTFGSAGTYAVTLTVVDGNNLSDPETKAIIVQAVPPPTPPTADFTFTCNQLVCSFTNESSEGSSAITTLSWNFGDGTPAASGSSVQHTFASSGSYPVTLTITDVNNLSDGETKTVTVQASAPQPRPITLTATGYKVMGRNTVDLVWTGATTNSVVISQNGVPVTIRPNLPQGTNTWTHSTFVFTSATWTYRVCQVDTMGRATSVCSPNVQVTF